MFPDSFGGSLFFLAALSNASVGFSNVSECFRSISVISSPSPSGFEGSSAKLFKSKVKPKFSQNLV